MSALLRSIAKTVSIASIAAVSCAGLASADPPKKPGPAAAAPAARPAPPPRPAAPPPVARPAAPPPAPRAAAPAPRPSFARPPQAAPHFARPAPSAPRPSFARPAPSAPRNFARPERGHPNIVRPNITRSAPNIARPNSERFNRAQARGRTRSEQPSAAIRQVPGAQTPSASRNAATSTNATLNRPVFRSRREARAAARAEARATRQQAQAARVQQVQASRVQARIQDRINARLARQNRLDPQRTGSTNSFARNRTATAAAAIGTAFAGRHAARAGWYRDWRRHRRASGWYGPLYWPYAYDSLFANVFIPYDDYGEYAYDPFWDYGYGDIYAGMFSPYDYDDLLTTQAPVAERRYASAPPQGASETTAAIQQLAPMCGDDSKDVAGVPVDEIQKAVNPDEKQLAALDELGNASVKAAQIVKASCPADIALTAPARMDNMKQRIDAMIEAVETVRKPLESFYGMLSDEQKARFNAVGQREEDRNASGRDKRRDDNGLARTCGMTNATQWPQTQIERSVKPTAAQQKSLDALREATDKAAEQLKASCPTDIPATPIERIAAIDARLHAMRDAIATVQAPLKDFYTSLSDAQKAQFNSVGRSRTRQG